MEDDLNFLNKNDVFQKEEIFTNFLNFKRKNSEDSLSDIFGRSVQNENSLKPNFCLFSNFNRDEFNKDQDKFQKEDFSISDKNDSIFILNNSLRHGLSLIEDKSFFNNNLKFGEINCFQNDNNSNINNSIKDKNKKSYNNNKLVNNNNNNSSLLNEKNINKNNSSLSDKNKSKKNLFKTITNKQLDEQKKKKLLMNRISAKKSRIKKKEYILELEKQLFSMKQDLSINDDNLTFLKKKKKNNNKENILSANNDSSILNNDINKLNYQNTQVLKNFFNLEDKEKNIYKDENDDLINEYSNNQAKFLQDIIIQNINFMMPIKLKLFQNKYLKIKKMNTDDSIDSIITKIDENIQMIKDLYSFDNENIINQNKISDSPSYQLFCFYKNLKQYIASYKYLIELVN